MPRLGIGASLAAPAKVGGSIVTDGLVLKHNYDIGAVVPISDGSVFFDGSSDYISLSSETDIAGDWTVSSWVKPTATNYKGIVGSEKSTQTLVAIVTANVIVRLEKASGTSYWYDNWDAGLGSFSTTEWSHLTVTKTGTTVTPYLNGVVGTAGTLSGSDGVLKVRAIGSLDADGTMGYKWDGNIAAVSIFSAVLTQTQIKSIMYKDYSGLTTSEKANLVSWWHLDKAVDSNYVADLADDTLGATVLTNGDFSDASVSDTWNGSSEVALVGWGSGQVHTADNHAVITNGKCRLISTGPNIDIRQDGSLVVGQIYYYSIEVTDVTDGHITLNAGYDVINIIDTGTYTGYLKATDARFYIKRNGDGGVCDATFDNISVKPTNGNYGKLK